MLQSIFNKIDQAYEDMVQIRRYLHERPELSFKEYETAEYIANYYRQLGIPVETKVGGNGVIAKVEGKLPGKTVAFRADFDALPIQDEKDVPYKSKVPGVMHACGHDAHTASLLVLGKILNESKDQLQGTVVLLHQHAEELPPGGAISILQSGALEEVDAIFGNHFWSTIPVGKVTTRAGEIMAGADRFTITIHGKGGHGAQPQETKDAVVIGSELVQALQKIVSRHISPIDTAVLTIGKFKSGNAFNIIADHAELEGTIRYLNRDVKERIKESLYKTVEGICLANEASFDIDYVDGYPPLVNSEKEAELIFKSNELLPDSIQVIESELQLASEDFAYYTEQIDGAFFFTGAKKDDAAYPHHHPRFDIDERAMPIAAKTFFTAYSLYQQE